MLDLFMALLSFRGIDTPSLPAQGEQRRSFYFNIDRDNSRRSNIRIDPIAMRTTLRMMTPSPS
jgi:hypothetical protein